MNIRVTGKHIKVTARMREHIEEKLDKLEKLAKQRDLIEAKVVLKIEKYLHIAEITLMGRELRFYGEGRSEEHFFAAFDEAELKVAVQLKKRKERIKNHHKIMARREIAEMVMTGAGEFGGPETSRAEESPRLIPEKNLVVKAMSVAEAQKKLLGTDRQFFVFRNAETKSVNVIYRRADGHFGLIESEA